jgi:hypothetical protein
VLDNEDEIAAYYGTWADFPWGSRFIRELSVRKGLPISAVLPAIQRFVQQQVKDNLADYGPTPPVTIQFDLGYQKDHQHPANLAMDSALTPYRPWEWYVRVADLPGFLVHIGPELERRLAESSMNGYEGDLKISFYQGGIRLLFDHGKLTLAEHWTSPELDEGHDAAFPDRTFLQLLFGFRSLDDLQYAFPDCWTNQQGKLLLNALFPKQPSWINY